MKRVGVLFLSLLLCITMCSCKSRSASAADKLILSIGEVTLDSEAAITKAEDAVSALEEKDFDQLEHLETLENARVTYEDLVNQEAAQEIIDAINAAKSNVALDSESKIASARRVYNIAADDVKKFVSNYDDLVMAETTLSDLKVADIVNRISAIGEVSLESKDDISTIRRMYTFLSEEEKSKVSNYAVLEEDVKTLRILQEDYSKKHPENQLGNGRISYKDKKTVDSNGKQVWKVYARISEMHFSGTFRGSGYFGIKILDSNQDFFALVANEIGDYNVDKSIYGLVPGQMYYIQIECTEGSWSCSWSGTYG